MFTVLTSMEMVSLCQMIAIVHCKICMSMRWLVGNTHHMIIVGHDWSAQPMGKAIDELHDVMVGIETDGSKFLDETFMNAFF